jgi:hypothetical protein
MVVNDELEKMWREMVITHLRYYPSITWRDMKTMKNYHSRQPVFGLKFQPGTIPNMKQAIHP